MNNDILFFDASEYTSNLRCTIQRTGKIGFSDFTQKKLRINENMSIKIGIEGTKELFDFLFLQLIDIVEPKAFKVNKAGNYFYINPKPLLDELGIEYKNKNIMYEMIIIDEGKKIYKLVKKEGKVTT